MSLSVFLCLFFSVLLSVLQVLFSTIAKPGMFGLGMAPKEGFLAYSGLFNLFDNKNCTWKRRGDGCTDMCTDMCQKSPITREWIYGISENFYAFMFFVYYLFICLIIFLHFYICNVWFILANNRILVFILELFL